MKIQAAILSLAMAGALAAQTTPAPATPAPSPSHPHRAAVNQSERMEDRLARRLNLTPDQQTHVKAIFAEARQQAKALAPQLRDERMALKAAVKSDSESQIDQITQQSAQLTAQREALHVKAMAKVYALLTPQQKARFDRMDSPRVSHLRRPAQNRS